MSSPPPSYESNPDRRPLPAGWIAQFDPNYKTWFYVNTEAKPPITTWTHPSGPESAPLPEQRYAPPPLPPRGANTGGPGGPSYPGGQGSYPGQAGGNYSQQSYGGYGGDPRSEYGAQGYQQNYPQQQSDGRGLGGLLGRLGGRHSGRISPGYAGGGQYGGGGYTGGGGYPVQSQQPQVVYAQQQAPPKKSGGIGMGGLALGAGAGLLGGVLLDEMFDRPQEEVIIENGGDYGDGGGFGGDDFF